MIHLTIDGTIVPALGFGTWQLRGAECERSVQDALSIGYRHIDTAQAYENEEQVGRGIKNSDVDRNDIFLVSKVRTSNFKQNDTIQSTHDSLRKLDVDQIDLMLMHWPNPDVPLKETLGALNELQDEGSIRHIGVSNFPPQLVQEATNYATIFCNQVEYHPYHLQDELVQQSRTMNYMLTAYSPLARGKVLDDPALREIAQAHNKSVAQVVLRWLMQQHVAAIPKAASDEHRRANFDIFDFELVDEEMKTIHTLQAEQISVV